MLNITKFIYCSYRSREGCCFTCLPIPVSKELLLRWWLPATVVGITTPLVSLDLLKITLYKAQDYEIQARKFRRNKHIHEHSYLSMERDIDSFFFNLLFGSWVYRRLIWRDSTRTNEYYTTNSLALSKRTSNKIKKYIDGKNKYFNSFYYV